jgi:hypothetical protein
MQGASSSREIKRKKSHDYPLSLSHLMRATKNEDYKKPHTGCNINTGRFTSDWPTLIISLISANIKNYVRDSQVRAFTLNPVSVPKSVAYLFMNNFNMVSSTELSTSKGNPLNLSFLLTPKTNVFHTYPIYFIIDFEHSLPSR